MTMTRATLLLTLCLGLAACGTGKPNSITATLTGLKDQIAGAATQVLRGKPKPGNARASLNRALIDQYPKPLIFADLIKTGAGSAMEFQAQNKSVRRYGAADGSALALQNGLLVRTHGLTFDLVSADVNDLDRALRRGGSDNALRVHRYLDGENKEVTRSYVCSVSTLGHERIVIFDVSHATRHMVEDCQNGEITFQNHYWVGTRRGIIWRSQSWIGPDLGIIQIENLSR